MFLKSKFLPAFFSSALILTLCAAAFADTIRLKDGSIIKGKIVTFRDQQFIVLIGDGSRQRQMAFFADEIEAIEFEGNPPLASNNANISNSNNATAILPRPSATLETRNTAQTPANNPPANTNSPVNNDVKTVDGNGDVSQPETAPVNSTPVNTPQSNNVQTTAQNNRPQTNVPVGSATVPNANPSRPKPIQLNRQVLADNTANGWTNTGWVARKGQKFRITAKERINLNREKGIFSGPEGIKSLEDPGKLMKNQPTGGLIAVIGDDNNDFIFIGANREFTAVRDGALFLGINEGVLDDNSGSFDVTVEIDPTNN